MTLRTLFCFLPFLVCLCWTACFIFNFRQDNKAKQMLAVFLATCTVLYLCHGLYFTTGYSHLRDCIWSFCSLAVYPFYYCYIRLLSTRKLSRKLAFLVILPGAVIAVIKFFQPSTIVDNVQKIVMLIQVLLVLMLGTRSLDNLNRQISEFYSDTEKRDATPIKNLLIVFVITSVASAIANVLGRQFFGDSNVLLYSISLTFSVLLFCVSYIGFHRDFTIEQFTKDLGKEEQPELALSEEEGKLLGQKLFTLIEEEEFFLNSNITLNDVAKRIGSCRTYVSNYINKNKGVSFSDYINELRIEHAKKLLSANRNEKMIIIAEMSGYANEQSFFRNFRKFTDMTPSEWIAKNHN